MQKLKKLKIHLLTLCLFAAIPLTVEGRCKAPERGPPGPPGALSSAYVSSYSTAVQSTTSNPYSILFNFNQFDPVHILHPVGGDNAQFQVQRSGVYLVSWLFTAIRLETAELLVNLFNVNTGKTFNPSPLLEQTIPDAVGANTHISGQTMVFLPAGTTIELTVLTIPDNSIIILNPTLVMTLIAPL